MRILLYMKYLGLNKYSIDSIYQLCIKLLFEKIASKGEI